MLMLTVPEPAAVLGVIQPGAHELPHSEGFLVLKIGNRSALWKAKTPITLEIQGLQRKNGPAESEQLTTVCSNWTEPFKKLALWPYGL